MDQPSVSSMYLNLDALSSSSEEESQDLMKRSDLSVTLTCRSEEAGTRVNSDEVFSDEDLERETLDRSSGGAPVRPAVRP